MCQRWLPVFVLSNGRRLLQTNFLIKPLNVLIIVGDNCHLIRIIRRIRQTLLDIYLIIPVIKMDYFSIWYLARIYDKNVIVLSISGRINIRFCKVFPEIFVISHSINAYVYLIHWGRLTHICVGKLAISGSIMTCRLDGTKPLSEPVLEYCKLDPWEQTSVKF